MDILILLAIILFGAGAVVGAILKDWPSALIAAGLFFWALDGVKL